MEFVEPIKDKAKIEAMKQWLKQRNYRDYLLFVLGINSGLRISDLLSLTVEDVVESQSTTMREQKTNKRKKIQWSNTCTSAINEYLKETGLTTGALFASRKPDGNGNSKAISRQQAYDIINKAAVETKVITKKNNMRIGCHSLRKTFGYHAYNSGVSLEKIQYIMNHSSSKTTLRYIGITEESLNEVYLGMNL